MDLFERSRVESENQTHTLGVVVPLAHRMRPRSLDEVVGHEHLLGIGKPLEIWTRAERLPSLIFWGPPGCGKTTLAKLLVQGTRARWIALSAVFSGVKDLRAAVSEASRFRDIEQRQTVLFVDEIHRFSKSQQDVLLPYVESGVVTLIGATTENPSFEINSALLSRTRVIRLEQLDDAALFRLLGRALEMPERGLGGSITVEDQILRAIVQFSEGDARRALTALDNLALAVPTGSHVDETLLKDLFGEKFLERALSYDKTGEEHYNVISAFIKSMRAGDPDAAVYYLARMLEGGEDPLFVARRMVVFASEDVGNADPRALELAIHAQRAAEFVGMPEARINLAHAAIYLAVAPKSRAVYDAIEAALSCVRETGSLAVPMGLRNAPTQLMKELGYGEKTQNESPLPAAIAKKRFYHPTENGLEKQIREKLSSRRR